MSSAALARLIAPAVPIAFRGSVPETDTVARRPVVGDLVADLRGHTPFRTPLLVVEVGLYGCNLELWSGSGYRELVRSFEEVEPYRHNDRELFGYPTQIRGGSVGDVRQWHGQADTGGLPRAA